MLHSPNRFLALGVALAVTLILVLHETKGPGRDLEIESATLTRTTLKIEPPSSHPTHNPSPSGQFLHGTLSLGKGNPLRNQSFEMELILYRPKPDVLLTRTITTDHRGQFSILVGDDYLTTTSIALRMSSTTEGYRTKLFPTTYIAQAPHGELADLGYIVLVDTQSLEE